MIVPLPRDVPRRTRTVGRNVQSSEAINDPDALILRHGPPRRHGTRSRDRFRRRSRRLAGRRAGRRRRLRPDPRPEDGDQPGRPHSPDPGPGPTGPAACARTSGPDSPPLLAHDRSRPPLLVAWLTRPAPLRSMPGEPTRIRLIVTISGRPFKPVGRPRPGGRTVGPLAPRRPRCSNSRPVRADRPGRSVDDAGGDPGRPGRQSNP